MGIIRNVCEDDAEAICGIYTELVARLRGLQVHSVIGGIALPNPASVGLHESVGFEKVAHFREVGWKMNKWIDVGYWELVFSHEVL